MSQQELDEQLAWTGPGWSPIHLQRFMLAGRNWQAVEQFYHQVVRGQASLADLGCASAEEALLGQGWQQLVGAQAEEMRAWQEQHGEEQRAAAAAAAAELPSGRGKDSRYTYRVAVSYFGPAYDGWMYQKQLATVEGALAQALAPLCPGTARPVVVGAGRTDKGVSAAGQVFSFHSWLQVSPAQVLAAASSGSGGTLRAWHVAQQPRSFHATFSAQWRRYVYLLPLRQQQEEGQQIDDALFRQAMGSKLRHLTSLDYSSVDCLEVDPQQVALRLAALEGRMLDYYAFGRDTPQGKECHCQLLRARATVVTIPTGQTSQHEQQSGSSTAACTAPTRALLVELVGNRFLRKMVRVLVASAVREALPQGARRPGDCAALVALAAARERRDTALPAPAVGLCFAGVGYDGRPPPPAVGVQVVA